jgi:hypothetical protein
MLVYTRYAWLTLARAECAGLNFHLGFREGGIPGPGCLVSSAADSGRPRRHHRTAQADPLWPFVVIDENDW